MSTVTFSTSRKPLQRSHCLDCHADFARHRARQRQADTIPRNIDLELLICPECGSQTVEEAANDPS